MRVVQRVRGSLTALSRGVNGELPTRASSGSGSSLEPLASRPSFDPLVTSPSATESSARVSVV